MARRTFQIPFFKVLYSSTFIILLLVLIALLFVSPADAIYQSYINSELINAIILAGVYVATFLVSAFIYATRLYTTRQHLANIPRLLRAPIRKGDVGPGARKAILENLRRSASIRWNAQPKSLAEENEQGIGEGQTPSKVPPWGIVQHTGWSSPDSPTLPGVQFAPVIAELVNLLEAKAVTLAPGDPLATGEEQEATKEGDRTTPTERISGIGNIREPSTSGYGDSAQVAPDGISLPDAHTVSLLQRPASMGARSYIFRLMDLGMLSDPDLASLFVAQYEAARFSGNALTEPKFAQLMRTFASLLESLGPPDPSAVEALREHTDTETSSHTPTSASLSRLSSKQSQTSLRSTSQASSVLHRFTTTESAQRQPRPPLPRNPSSFLTPFFTPRPGSISSNDGDHESDTSSERYTVHTAFTRPDIAHRSVSGLSQFSEPRRLSQRRRSRRNSPRSASRRDLSARDASRRGARSVSRPSRPSRQNSYLNTPRAGSVYATPMLESRHSSKEDLDAPSEADSDRSVVRKVMTGTSARSAVSGKSWGSGESGGSVLRREIPEDSRGGYFGGWGR